MLGLIGVPRFKASMPDLQFMTFPYALPGGGSGVARPRTGEGMWASRRIYQNSTYGYPKKNRRTLGRGGKVFRLIPAYSAVCSEFQASVKPFSETGTSITASGWATGEILICARLPALKLATSSAVKPICATQPAGWQKRNG